MNNNNTCTGWRRLLLLCLLIPVTGWAITAANTIIRNQASATFKDEAGNSYSVTSNVVETLVQQVAGVELEQSQSKQVSDAGTVNFPHTLTNTGNAIDSFNLSVSDETGDNYDFISITLFADSDQNGQADDPNTPLTVSPLLAAGESFSFIVKAEVPGGLSEADQGQFTLTAASAFDSAKSTTNTNTAEVTNQAIVEVTKSISHNAGAAGSGNYTVTLRYENLSDQTATDVTLIDALPSGMNYVTGSGRWSETDATVLTDSDPNDLQNSGGTDIRYCAYDPSCLSIPEATQDTDSDTTNQVTAIISSLPANTRGTVSFEVSIGSSLAASTLNNIAEYEYNDGTGIVTRIDTNRVNFEIIQNGAVVANGSSNSDLNGTDEPATVASVPQGGTAIFNNYIWNTGNGDDSFDLNLDSSSFPAGTAIQLFHADGFTPLQDTNGNGTPDTGVLPSGAVKHIVVKARLNPGAANGSYSVTLTAVSFADPNQFDSIVNTLQAISSGSVDLTNNTAGGDGAGDGPEGSAVVTNTVSPGTNTRFTLYINNSATVDSYNLSASTDPSFAGITLPAGWTVTFTDAENNDSSNTGNIAANTSKLVYADVNIPANTPVATTALYFRALSPVTGVQDIIHNAVTIGEVTDVALTSNNQAQLMPGNFVFYSHTLSNQGNAPKTDITFNHINSQPEWQSVLYEDTDGDYTLSEADATITTLSSLNPGESKLLFLKVFSPATAPMGTVNITTITASWDGGASSTQAQDTSTVNRSDVTITKQQAPDISCDGMPDTAFGYSGFEAEPGSCVIYLLTATNTGLETMNNVRIQDATPVFTSFITANGLPTISQGSLDSVISNGDEGDIIGNIGSLAAGHQATLRFGIRID